MPFGSGASGPVLSGPQGAVSYDDSGPLLDLLAATGFTMDVKVQDVDDVGEYVLIRSPSLIRINADGGQVNIRNTAGTKNNVRLNGSVGIGVAVNAVPPDVNVDTSEAVLWFDSTNGAGNTKLMVKGKSADGTVKTASIVLA